MQALVNLVCSSPSELQNSKQLIDGHNFLEDQTDGVDVFLIVQNAARPRQIKTHLPFEFLPLGARGPNPPKVTLSTSFLILQLWYY